jgi:hypothetical protein
VMFFTALVQHDDSRRPGNVKIAGQRLGVKKDLHRNEVLVHISNDLGVGVRNRTHLLAADSAGVKKIQQDIFFFSRSPSQPGLEIAFPLDFVMHGLPAFEDHN